MREEALDIIKHGGDFTLNNRWRCTSAARSALEFTKSKSSPASRAMVNDVKIVDTKTNESFTGSIQIDRHPDLSFVYSGFLLLNDGDHFSRGVNIVSVRL